MSRSLLSDQDSRTPDGAGIEATPEHGSVSVDMDATGEDGLSESEAQQRLAQYGKNELPDVRIPKWKIFLSHFTGIMPGMIILAVLIELLLQEWPDFSTLLALLFLNGFVGFWEDMRAGDAVAALKASLKPEASVKRDGAWRKIDASLLVSPKVPHRGLNVK